MVRARTLLCLKCDPRMLLLNSPTFDTTKDVPSSVQAMKWADFGSLIILPKASVQGGSRGNEWNVLVELAHEVVRAARSARGHGTGPHHSAGDTKATVDTVVATMGKIHIRRGTCATRGPVEAVLRSSDQSQGGAILVGRVDLGVRGAMFDGVPVARRSRGARATSGRRRRGGTKIYARGGIAYGGVQRHVCVPSVGCAEVEVRGHARGERTGRCHGTEIRRRGRRREGLSGGPYTVAVDSEGGEVEGESRGVLCRTRVGGREDKGMGVVGDS